MAEKKEILDDTKVIETSDGQKQRTTSISEGVQNRITRISSIFMVLISGLALFSDGFNAQIIGYMNPLFKELYPDVFSSTIKTRLSNAYLIGEIFGMLFFGYTIDKLGRRTGIFFATIFLVLGVIIATAAHGRTDLGMFWMMIVGRGVAGFGAGGEFSKNLHVGGEKTLTFHQGNTLPVEPALQKRVTKPR
jgi:fucose permease